MISLVAGTKFNVFNWLLRSSSMYFIGYLDKVQCISLVSGTKLNVFHWLLGQSSMYFIGC